MRENARQALRQNILGKSDLKMQVAFDPLHSKFPETQYMDHAGSPNHQYDQNETIIQIDLK